MRSDLLPCPFCGGPAKADFCEPVRGCHAGDAWVECEACELHLYAHSRSSGTVDDAIAAWNTRPASATMAEIVAAAEAWVTAEKELIAFDVPGSLECAAKTRARFLALVAAHEAEVERLRAENVAMRDQIEASQMRRLEIGDEIKDRMAQKLALAEAQSQPGQYDFELLQRIGQHDGALELAISTARESAAREMRERCAKICESKGRIAAIEAAATIRALPLTPTDGAKDE